MNFLLSLLLSSLILLISLTASAKEKADDFKEIFSADDSEVESKVGVESAEETPASKLKENEEVLSGHVRVLRRIDRTEVFFKDLKESYFIPSGASYSTLYKAFEQSHKKGTSVSFRVHTKTRQILSLENVPVKSPSAGGSGENTKNGAGAQ